MKNKILNNLDFDNLLFQLTKKSTDIYINYNNIDFSNFFSNDIQYININNIVTQQLLEVQYGQRVLDLFLSARNNSQIQYKDILNNLSNRWLYKQDFKNAIVLEDLPIIYYVYEFKNLQSTKQALSVIFKTYFYKNQQSILNSYFNEFKTCAGYFKKLRNIKTGFFEGFLMCIDINYLNKQIIKHQLTHYFQTGLYVLGKLKQIDKSKVRNIPELNFTKDELIYLFEKTEFDAWILVNLQYTLKYLFYTYYKVKYNDYKDFLKYFIDLIETFKENITTIKEWNIIQNLLNVSLKRSDNINAIKLVAASCYLNIQWGYLKNKILTDF